MNNDDDDYYIPFEGPFRDGPSTRPLRPGELEALKRSIEKIRQRRLKIKGPEASGDQSLPKLPQS